MFNLPDFGAPPRGSQHAGRRGSRPRRPTPDDEMAATQCWFIRVRRGRTRRPWRFGGDNGPARVTGDVAVFSPPVPRFAYASERATFEVPTRAVPFSSERELWTGVRGNI